MLFISLSVPIFANKYDQKDKKFSQIWEIIECLKNGISKIPSWQNE